MTEPNTHVHHKLDMTDILIALAVLTYDISSLIALTNTSLTEAHTTCPESKLWQYIAAFSGVTIILWLFDMSRFYTNKERDLPSQTFMIFLICLIYFIGGIQEYDVPCVRKFEGTLLYILLELTILITGITTGYIFALFLNSCSGR